MKQSDVFSHIRRDEFVAAEFGAPPSVWKESERKGNYKFDLSNFALAADSEPLRLKSPLEIEVTIDKR